MKNDSPCGSTIGPILSTLAGIRAVDIGNPQLSMHRYAIPKTLYYGFVIYFVFSIREQAGVADVTHAIDLLRVCNLASAVCHHVVIMSSRHHSSSLAYMTLFISRFSCNFRLLTKP